MNKTLSDVINDILSFLPCSVAESIASIIDSYQRGKALNKIVDQLNYSLNHGQITSKEYMQAVHAFMYYMGGNQSPQNGLPGSSNNQYLL